MDWVTLADFVQQNQLLLLISSIAVQLVLLLLLFFVWLKNRKQYQRLRPLLQQADTTKSIAATIEQQAQGLSALESNLQALVDTQARLRQQQALAVQHIGYYRYNAFPDTGGELSFSIALLDGKQEGFILTSLYGRQDARVYAKQVKAGGSAARLSPEEQEAIRLAVTGKQKFN